MLRFNLQVQLGYVSSLRRGVVLVQAQPKPSGSIYILMEDSNDTWQQFSSDEIFNILTKLFPQDAANTEISEKA